MTATINTRVGLRGVMAIAVLVAALILILPGQAFAAGECSDTATDPTQAQYCPTPPPPPVSPPEGGEEEGANEEGGNEESGGEEGGVSGVSSSGGGSLPFTGLDAIALLSAALALGGAGFALRRLSSTGI